MEDRKRVLDMTSVIVAAYLHHNAVPVAEIPSLIRSVRAALANSGDPVDVAVLERQKPAVAIKKSVTPDYIICLEDGKRFKTMRGHLRSKYDMTPQEYRAKWALPRDYPMTAPSYAQLRSEIAKNAGLGLKISRNAKLRRRRG